MRLVNWISGWWNTFRIWRESDAETWAYLTSPHNPDDYVEVTRPE